MILLSWQDDYAVGVRQIDQEHRTIFGLINQFHDRYANGESQPQILPLLNWLVTYAEQHFQHEEALMQACGYPGLVHHQALHERLYASIFALNESLSLGNSRVDFDTLRFLKNWLLGHILKEDMDIGDFVRRKALQTEKAARGKGQGAQEKAEDLLKADCKAAAHRQPDPPPV